MNETLLLIFYQFNKLNKKSWSLVNMNEFKLKSHNQSMGEGGSYRQIRQYTYFDSVTRKYLEQRKKNEVKKEQNRIEKERKELAKCTFKPAIESKHYYQTCKKIEKIKETVIQPKNQNPKPVNTAKPEGRLLDWGNRRDLTQRNKIIEKELDLIGLTKSLSKEKVFKKLNRSLQDMTRTPTHEQSFSQSIKAVPILSREDSSSLKNYKTIQQIRRNR